MCAMAYSGESKLAQSMDVPRLSTCPDFVVEIP